MSKCESCLFNNGTICVRLKKMEPIATCMEKYTSCHYWKEAKDGMPVLSGHDKEREGDVPAVRKRSRKEEPDTEVLRELQERIERLERRAQAAEDERDRAAQIIFKFANATTNTSAILGAWAKIASKNASDAFLQSMYEMDIERRRLAKMTIK